MKKLFLLIIMLGSFAACKKRPVCICKVTDTASGQSTTYEMRIKQRKRSDAVSVCERNESTMQGPTEKATCELK